MEAQWLQRIAVALRILESRIYFTETWGNRRRSTARVCDIYDGSESRGGADALGEKVYVRVQGSAREWRARPGARANSHSAGARAGGRLFTNAAAAAAAVANELGPGAEPFVASSGNVAPSPDRRISADSSWLNGVGLRESSFSSGGDGSAPPPFEPKLTAFASGALDSGCACAGSMSIADGDEVEFCASI
jgi:hypothetical protein